MPTNTVLGLAAALACALLGWSLRGLDAALYTVVLCAGLPLVVLVAALWARRTEQRALAPLIDAIQTRLAPGAGTTDTDAQARLQSLLESVADDGANERRASEALVTSERFLTYRLRRLERVLHTVPVGVIVLDEDKCLDHANTRARAFLDIDETTGGTPLSRLQLWSPLDRIVDEFERGSQTPRQPAILTPPGTQVSLSLSINPIIATGSDGTTTTSGYLLFLADATREVRAQEKRSEFVAHVSHELKSPLNTLSLVAEGLKGPDGEDDEFRTEAINVITDEVERLSRLVANLLNVTQIEMGNMEMDRSRTRLLDLVQDAVESTRRSAVEKRLEFNLEIPQELPAVLIDKDLMRIALNNLLTNAIKYSNEDTQITIGIADGEDTISISVADQGIGIAAEDQTNIFNKFYRADDQDARSRGGQGLGLALANEIVQLHHGSIRVDSEPGVGSTFTIELWKGADLIQEAI
ncbi:MAG: ATP-binding protein [Pseudomonadota bacterium]